MTTIYLIFHDNDKLSLTVDDDHAEQAAEQLISAIGTDTVINVRDSWFSEAKMKKTNLLAFNMKEVIAVGTRPE